MIVFNPRAMEAQLSNPPPCPQYHWMLADGNIAGCSFQQLTEVQMDFPTLPPSELLTKNIAMRIDITPHTNPLVDFIDQAKTIASLNTTDFSGWTAGWSFDPAHAYVHLTLSRPVAVPVQSFYSATTTVFTIYTTGLPNTTYAFTYDQAITGLLLEIAIPPSQLACQGTSQNGLNVIVPNYIPILLGGTVEFMNNDLADGVCSASGGFNNRNMDLYKVLDPTLPLDQDVTNTSGYYEFGEVVSGCEYKIEPQIGHADDVCGLYTSDLVKIQGHLLGQAPHVFTEAWEYIAGDATLNGSVSTADISLIRKIILGSISELPKGWRFMYKDDYNLITIPPTGLILFDDHYQDILFAEKLDINFAGVKVGDVKGSCDICTVNFDGGGVKTRDKTNIIHENYEEKRISLIEYDSETKAYMICEDVNDIHQICKVYLSNSTYDAGIMSLNYTGSSSVEEIIFPSSQVDYDFKSVIDNDENNIRFTWLGSVDDLTPIAIIKLKSTSNQSSITWTLDETFDNYTTLEDHHSQLKFETSQGNTLQLNIIQNPIVDQLDLSIISNVANTSKLFVYDLTGKVLLDRSFYIQKGASNYTINELRHFPKGTYILHLTSDGFNLTKTFIKQ